MKINFKRFRNIIGGVGGSLLVASTIATFFTRVIPLDVSAIGMTGGVALVIASIVEQKEM